MHPRWYQSESVAACWDFIRTKPGNPCIVLPTGAGKSLVIAMMARDVVAWKGRCLVLAHRKELLEQNAEKIASCVPGLDVGVFSAGLRRKEHGQDVVVAGIQSCFKKQAAYNLGHRDIVIIDEAHLIPTDGEGMYNQLLGHLKQINPYIRVPGLTATPYRLDNGFVCGPDYVLNEVCYEVPLLRLIHEGYLCPLTSKDPVHKMDTDGVGLKGGEFILSQLDDHAAQLDIVRAATLELLSWTHDRHSILLFCCGRKHAGMLASCLAEQVPASQVGYVDGTTPPGQRAAILKAFKDQAIRYLVNIDVLTTGFDAPNVDCVGLFRPTMSPALLYQMIGRGFRLHPSKQNCLVLDFARNIETHGPVDQLKPPKAKAAAGSGGGTPGVPPSKACPTCKELVAIQVMECPACSYRWPEQDPSHDAHASTLPVLSDGKPTVTKEWVDVVKEPAYSVYLGKTLDSPRTLRVTYKLAGVTAVSEYVYFDHPPGSFARRKAERWWKERTDHPCPNAAWDAYWLLKDLPELLKPPVRMQLKWVTGRKWPEILEVELGPAREVDPMKLEEAMAVVDARNRIFFQ